MSDALLQHFSFEMIGPSRDRTMDIGILKPEPPRFRATAVFEWEGDPPPEIIALAQRAEAGR